MLTGTLLVALALSASTLRDEYAAFFSALSLERDYILWVGARGTAQGTPIRDHRVAQTALVPLEDILERDLGRLTLEGLGALPGDVDRCDVNGDGQVTLEDHDALLDLVVAGLREDAPRTTRARRTWTVTRWEMRVTRMRTGTACRTRRTRAPGRWHPGA